MEDTEKEETNVLNHHLTDSGLQEHPIDKQFPQGHVCFEVSDRKFCPSWTMVTTDNHRITEKGMKVLKNRVENPEKWNAPFRKVKQICLGVFKCPMRNCPFRCPPVNPRTGNTRKKIQKAIESGKIYPKTLNTCAKHE